MSTAYVKKNGAVKRVGYCVCHFSQLCAQKGGFKAALDHGLSVNRSIVIRGRANPNAER